MIEAKKYKHANTLDEIKHLGKDAFSLPLGYRDGH